MSAPTFPESTTFSRDIEGRYVCNTLDEAKASTDTALRPDARPFDIIIIGGGSFGSALASALFERDKGGNHRILVLEAGPLALHEHVQNIPLPGFTPPTSTNLGALQALQAASNEGAIIISKKLNQPRLASQLRRLN